MVLDVVVVALITLTLLGFNVGGLWVVVPTFIVLVAFDSYLYILTMNVRKESARNS